MFPARGVCLLCLALMTAPVVSTVQAARPATGTPNTWTEAAPLPTGRWDLTAAGADGKIFLFGGFGCSTNACTTFDAYDPQTNAWTSMGDMPDFPDGRLSATTGPDGRIYLSGVPVPAADSTAPPGTTMAVYDPRGNTWTHEAPPPGIQGVSQLVTGLDGTIYAVGGDVNGSPSGTLSAFNVSTHAWTQLASFPTPREAFGTAVGPDGRIYVIGGYGPDSPATGDRVDAYDPKTNAWSRIAPLPTPRAELQAVTGPDGRIYAIGGGSGSRCFTSPCNVVEAYDVRTETWTAVAPLPHPRWWPAATVGPDGRIFVVGGSNAVGYAPPDALVTAVDTYTVVPADQPLPQPPPAPTSVTRKLASMPTGRQDLGVVTGTDRKIYAIGGQQIPGSRILRTVEAYDPRTNKWTAGRPLPAARHGMGVARSPDGRIYVLGGVAIPWDPFPSSNGIAGLRTVFIYNPRTRRWSRSGPMPDGRYGLAAVTGKDGRIYTIGGATHCYPSDAVLARVAPAMPPGGQCRGTRTVRRFDPRTGAWKTLASLQRGRLAPAAAVGPDGRIFVFGGDDFMAGADPRFEIYDPRSDRWSWGPPAPHSRVQGFAAAAAADGRIDLIGGCFAQETDTTGGFSATCGSPSPVDAYDPRANGWTTLGMTLNSRLSLAATTGPDGRVYAVGGVGDGNGRLLEVIRGVRSRP